MGAQEDTYAPARVGVARMGRTHSLTNRKEVASCPEEQKEQAIQHDTQIRDNASQDLRGTVSTAIAVHDTLATTIDVLSNEAGNARDAEMIDIYTAALAGGVTPIGLRARREVLGLSQAERARVLTVPRWRSRAAGAFWSKRRENATLPPPRWAGATSGWGGGWSVRGSSVMPEGVGGDPLPRIARHLELDTHRATRGGCRAYGEGGVLLCSRATRDVSRGDPVLSQDRHKGLEVRPQIPPYPLTLIHILSPHLVTFRY